MAEDIIDFEGLRGLTNEKFKAIIQNHPDLMEILDLKEKIDVWRQTLARIDENNNESRNVLNQSTGSITLKRKEQNNVYINFSAYFLKDFNGRIISENFKIEPLLSNQQKYHIVRSAGEYLLLDITDFPKEFPRESEYKAVAEEVILQFPGIFSLKDLIGFKKKCEGGSTSYSRGKLQQRLYDVAKLLKKKTAKLQEVKAKDNYKGESNVAVALSENDQQNDPLNLEEVENALDFLKNNSGPESKIMDFWKITFNKRREMKFDNFPALKLSFGPSMILYDFDKLYPGRVDDFKQNFENYKEKMMRQFNVEISNKIGRERIKYLEGDVDSNTENLLYLALLPFLFKPIAKKSTNMKKPTIMGAADMFICHVKVTYSYIESKFLLDLFLG